MTKEELLAFLCERLEVTQAACCIHQDEYGTQYAPECQGELDGFAAAIEAVQGMHTTDFVDSWLRKQGRQAVSDSETFWLVSVWREEMP